MAHYGFMILFGEWDLRERCSRHPSSKRYHKWCWSIFLCFSRLWARAVHNKRLYIRLSRTGSRKTYCKAFYLNPIGFAPISGLWRMVLSARSKLTAKLQFIGEFAAVGRALTKTFIHMPFVGTPYGFMIPFGEWDLRERCSRHPSSKRYHKWCWSIFFVFSRLWARVVHNKRLYIRLSRTGSRKTYCKAFYLNPIGFAPISGLWRMVLSAYRQQTHR